jgi:hypothetical protein
VLVLRLKLNETVDFIDRETELRTTLKVLNLPGCSPDRYVQIGLEAPGNILILRGSLAAKEGA